MSNDRNCCINTDIIPTLNFEYNFIFENNESYSSNQYVFGTGATETRPRMNIRLNSTSGGGYMLYLQSSSGSAETTYNGTSTMTLNKKYNIKLTGDYNNKKYYLLINNFVNKSGTYNPNTAYTDEIRFFNYSGDKNTSAANMKVYYFSLKNNGILVREMIPCYRINGTVVGMYDIVNDVFYTNVGNGTFEKGPNV